MKQTIRGLRFFQGTIVTGIWILGAALGGGITEVRAVNLPLALDQIVSPGVPGAGAGQIDVATDIDTFAFSGTNGQAIYFQEISIASTFHGFLQWELRRPTGNTIISSGYFDGRDNGRLVLPETGTYTLRVKVGSSNTNYIGDYSFCLRTIPPDDTFPIAIGDTITNGLPATGAGNIEVPGAQDIYTFQATNGQSAFFEDVSVSSAFHGWLQWEVKAPSGATLFRSYLDGTVDGRKTFTETGTYTLRVWSGYDDVTYIGAYSFRIRVIPPEVVVPIQLGQLVSNGVPVPGAGNIEVPGAQDVYSFPANAGQTFYFAKVAADASFGGWLKWELQAPSGLKVFSSFFSGDAGRKVLPENGTYLLRFFVGTTDPRLLGTYAFKVTAPDDSTFAYHLGQTVELGVPGPGAGWIESSGAQDLYTFNGNAGQKIIVQTFYSSPDFGGWLQYQIRGPSSNQVALAYFDTRTDRAYVLPETGSYTVRIAVPQNESTRTGEYSFRIYSPVVAGPDTFKVSPGGQLFIPKAKSLCNDHGEIGDSLDVSLIDSATLAGGTIEETNGFWHYTPPAGFSGLDSFDYTLSGAFGGTDKGTVTIGVVPGADVEATVVSTSRPANNLVDLCLFGDANATYRVETSTNLFQWQPAGTLTADPVGSISYQFTTTLGDRKFFRFPKQ